MPETTGAVEAPSHFQGTQAYQAGTGNNPPKGLKEILAESGYKPGFAKYEVYCETFGETVVVELHKGMVGDICPACKNEKGTKPGQCSCIIGEEVR